MNSFGLELQPGTAVEFLEIREHSGRYFGLFKMPGLAVREDHDPPVPTVFPALVFPKPLIGEFSDKIFEDLQVLPDLELDARLRLQGRVIFEDLRGIDLVFGASGPHDKERHHQRVRTMRQLKSPGRNRGSPAKERQNHSFGLAGGLIAQDPDHFFLPERAKQAANARAAADGNRAVAFAKLVDQSVDPRIFLLARQHMDRRTAKPGPNLQKFPVSEMRGD